MKGMAITASRLRENVYKILDEVLETGVPVEIERKGQKLRIVPTEPVSMAKLRSIPRRDDEILCDPEDLVRIDWLAEWEKEVRAARRKK